MLESINETSCASRDGGCGDDGVQCFGVCRDALIEPATPTTRTPIAVRVPAGFCHGFIESPNQPELVTVGPGQLRLIADGIALEEGNPFCVVPPFVYRFEIGALPAGTYTLQIFIRDEISSLQTVGFGSVSFVVTEPMPIPSNATWALALAALGLASTGFFALRARSQH